MTESTPTFAFEHSALHWTEKAQFTKKVRFSRYPCQTTTLRRHAQPQEQASSASPAKTARLVPSSPSGQNGPSTGSGLQSMKSGELLSEDAQLVELTVANGRYGHKMVVHRASVGKMFYSATVMEDA